jgi:hypothetical protein
LAGPLVVDGRRLLDAASMRSLGYRYETVGSATVDPGIADRQRTAPAAETEGLPIR